MDYYTQNRKDWINIISQIFTTATPTHSEWTNSNDIVSILNLIGSVDNSNHMFYPSGGGLDIESSKLSNEPECIEIFTGITDILKPKRLMAECFDDPIWNYFRLETLELQSSGVYDENTYQSEELIEIEAGKYINRRYWDIGEYEEKPLPSTARLVSRHLRGSFVIFAKSSYYNRHSSTYDARHDKMSSEEFRLYIENVKENGW